MRKLDFLRFEPRDRPWTEVSRQRARTTELSDITGEGLAALGIGLADLRVMRFIQIRAAVMIVALLPLAPSSAHAGQKQVRKNKLGTSISLGLNVVFGNSKSKIKTTMKERGQAKTRLTKSLDELNKSTDSWCGWDCAEKVKNLKSDAEMLGYELDHALIEKAVGKMFRGKMTQLGNYAAQGAVLDVKMEVESMESDAKALGYTLPPEVTGYLNTARNNALKEAWKLATSSASSGYKPGFDTQAGLVRQYSKDLGMTVDEDKLEQLAAQTKKVAKKNAKEAAKQAKLQPVITVKEDASDYSTKKKSSFGSSSYDSYGTKKKDDDGGYLDYLTNPLSPKNYLNPANPFSPLSPLYND
jgi:hypothetical protein